MKSRAGTGPRHTLPSVVLISGLAVSLAGTAHVSASRVLAALGSKPSSKGASNTVPPFRYTGPGSCSSVACHGSVKPRAETRISQDEYSTWVMKDKHSRAFAALSNPIALRMARLLGLGAPDADPKCLTCHALKAPPEERGRTFDLSDGVSCEACHGPASAWLGEHTTRGWPHERSLALGMRDTRDLVKRTQLCLTCHLGEKDKTVDHQMIAAGHPDLYFELSSFSGAMPRHWKEPPETGPGWDAREWAVGQAVQLRAALDRLAVRAQGKTWPEYAELDCFACHHTLTSAGNSWRQQRGYPGRRPGDPPWNESRYVLFHVFLQEVNRPAAQQLDEQIGKLAREINRLSPDRSAVASMCAASTRALDGIIERLNGINYDNALTLRLLKAISGDADSLSAAGERSAEQAAMALDSLYASYSRDHKLPQDSEIQSAINGLFRLVEDPAAYDQFEFVRQMRRVRVALR